METIGVNVQFDESDDDQDQEDMYGEERMEEEESEGESTDEEMEAQRHAIQAAAVSNPVLIFSLSHYTASFVIISLYMYMLGAC